jgi:hypothetical protein
LTTTIDLDRPSRLLTPAIRSGVEAFRARRAFHAESVAGLAAAAEELRRAIAANDPAAAEKASAHVRERQLVVDACPPLEIGPDLAAQMRTVVSRVTSRWGEISADRPTETYDEALDKTRISLGRHFAAWQRAWQQWSVTGEGAERGFALFSEAVDIDDELDGFVATWPPEPRREDHLSRREAQPERTLADFIDLNRNR